MVTLVNCMHIYLNNSLRTWTKYNTLVCPETCWWFVYSRVSLDETPTASDRTLTSELIVVGSRSKDMSDPTDHLYLFSSTTYLIPLSIDIPLIKKKLKVHSMIYISNFYLIINQNKKKIYTYSIITKIYNIEISDLSVESWIVSDWSVGSRIAIG